MENKSVWGASVAVLFAADSRRWAIEDGKVDITPQMLSLADLD